MKDEDETLHCPVCRARFRQSAECPRCGAGLSALMGLAAEAFRLRRAARRALRAGDVERAHDLSARARALHATSCGKRLHRFVSALVDFGCPDGPARE